MELKEATKMKDTAARATLRAEVEAGYLKRINHEMSDEEFEVYTQKDHLLFALDKADFRNETI